MNPLKKTIITILIIVILFTQSMLLCNGLELSASKIESFVLFCFLEPLYIGILLKKIKGIGFI